jgi:S-adenosylmethionine synthetase
MSVLVDTFGTGVVDDDRLSAIVGEAFDFRPQAIIRTLDLLKPIYRKTAAFGHFGRNEPGFTWERTDRIEDLKQAAGL